MNKILKANSEDFFKYTVENWRDPSLDPSELFDISEIIKIRPDDRLSKVTSRTNRTVNSCIDRIYSHIQSLETDLTD